MNTLHHSKVLVTGGAGFIGSNLVEALLKQDNHVKVLDNFSTGKRENIQEFLTNPQFELLEGDIRNLETCQAAAHEVEFVFHQAALGSVPRSINDPITSNEVNVNGFLNMLVAARDQKVKRFVYAASSSTYGDHPDLPKVEDRIGKPLSPYAITKYVNELYADVFAQLYGLETIGLRYFNVFGPKQDPYGAYAAVIPKFVKALIRHEAPVINGDGLHSRDFTFVENVVSINQLAALTNHPEATNKVYNVAFGENTSLLELYAILRELLSQFDPDIAAIEPTHGPERPGDVRHSLASIDRAANLLQYNPQFDLRKGLELAVPWYWENLQ